jgi:hypothetical protein
MKQPSSWRFSLGACFLLQWLVAPAFLAPMYHRLYAERDPPFYVFIAAFLLIPASYAAVFAWLAAARAAQRRRSVVFAAIRHGVLFAILFAAFALGPLAVVNVVNSAVRFRASLPPLAQNSPLPPSFYVGKAIILAEISGLALVHYAVVGGTAGGVVGLFVDWRARRGATD